MAFADENGMASFLMSAKTADQVKHCFVKVASELSGAGKLTRVQISLDPIYFLIVLFCFVVLNRNEMQVHSTVVKATIVNHKRHDEDVNDGKVPDYKAPSSCILS
jgi:hypothetical protein